MFQPPIVEWLRGYKIKEDLFDDVIAGLTVFVFLIPQGMAYAVLGGMPPVYGLYTASIPLFIYAILGTSRHISLGPMAITSLLLGQMVSKFEYPVGSSEFIQIGMFITCLTGFIMLLAGLLKLGALSNFLSPSVLSGFLTGSSCVIVINQIKYIFGLRGMPRFAYSHEIIGYVITHLKETNVHALWIGLSSVLILWLSKRYRGWYKSNIKTINSSEFTASARNFHKGAFLLCILSSLIVLMVGSAVAGSLITTNRSTSGNPLSKELAVVGTVPAGLLPPTFRCDVLSMDDIMTLIPECIVLAVITFTGNWAVCTKYAVAFNYEVDASQELIASGVTNILGPFFHSFIASGGIARSAVNVESGAKTQLAGCITAVCIIIALLAFTSLFSYIPMTVLASIILVSIVSTMDFEDMLRTWRIDRRDCFVMVSTFLVTFFVGVVPGVQLGCTLSFCTVLITNGFPPIIHLGRIVEHGSVHWRNIQRYKDAVQLPGISVLRLDAGSLFFANVAGFKEVVKQACKGAFQLLTSSVNVRIH